MHKGQRGVAAHLALSRSMDAGAGVADIIQGAVDVGSGVTSGDASTSAGSADADDGVIIID